MNRALPWRMMAGAALVLTLTAAGPLPDKPPPLDPNWPCQQIKIDHLSLATVWAGPPLGKYQDGWQQDSRTADLARRLAQRRVPLAQAQTAITDFARAAGDNKQAALLTLVGGLFSLLDEERFAVVQGLDRFGARQKSYAADIRAEITALHDAQDAAKPDPQKVKKLSEQIHWDTRVFSDRNSMISYACFVPDEIEHRLFALAGTASGLLQ